MFCNKKENSRAVKGYDPFVVLYIIVVTLRTVKQTFKSFIQRSEEKEVLFQGNRETKEFQET